MTLKTKLLLGLGFLFLIIFTLTGFCSYYVGKSGHEAENILKDNYDSIVYSKNMISALDDMMNSVSGTLFDPNETGAKSHDYRQLFETGKSVFEANLKAENNNITEIQEKEYVNKLNRDYEIYLNLCLQIKEASVGRSFYFNDFEPACGKLKQSINGIYDINMQAVVRKSQLAKRDSDRFKSTMAAVAMICFILALGYFWYFPFYISNSINYLANRMIGLLDKMGLTSDVKTKDEAWVILNAIKLLENRISTQDTDKTFGPRRES